MIRKRKQSCTELNTEEDLHDGHQATENAFRLENLRVVYGSDSRPLINVAFPKNQTVDVTDYSAGAHLVLREFVDSTGTCDG